MTHPRHDGGIGPIPWTPRVDPQGQPALQQTDALLADGVIAAAVVYEGRPGVLFTFGNGGHRHPPILLLHLDGLPELIANAVASARAHDGFETDEPTPEHVTCPSCGRRLFGDVALFGTCLDCREATG